MLTKLTRLQTKGFSLRSIKYLVLDEADRLLDLDFGPVLDKILKVCLTLEHHGKSVGWLTNPATEPTVRSIRISPYLPVQCDNELESGVTPTSFSSQSSSRVDKCDISRDGQNAGPKLATLPSQRQRSISRLPAQRYFPWANDHRLHTHTS